ncbi:sensor histidine kinase [Mucilaginibacter ginkgonis]|uniref:histidine kinase n=1 Tax=Mucilaginibacter ginkgonis TaxID=2682091 RepID=A0A6I4I4K9_9SPHI|nr:HAMP domain-containing sensor histidine kinase [Mucilaginibacter ginkgonis]QQL48945.1 HAMP domain-containing histidine kinase [Mucilaginibacter ginkgonis]
MVNKLKAIWPRLVGNSDDFSLESRIFHSITVALMVLAVFYIPYNFFVGMYIASFSALVMTAFFLFEYYNSRFKGVKHNSVLFGVTGIVLFSVNYFANSGISGSTDIIWPAYLLLVLAIAPYKHQLTWLIIYILAFMALHVVAYYNPQWVRHPFTAGQGELVDRITAFPMPVITIFIVIKYIRKKYNKERAAVAEKALALEIQNEQISHQKQQIEKSDAEKNKLMSIISHDMRAPLFNIQSYLEILTESDIEPSQRAAIEHDLLAATNGATDMLTNLLQWSKSQMQGSEVHLATLILSDALKNTHELCQMQAIKKSISFNFQIDPAITVIADADMLELVIRNLVNNAIKFTPAGGAIAVNATVGNGECKITVSDNGKGIDYDKQQNLFSLSAEPGYGTNNEKGVGLGLTLCKEFIERQNGRISFESTPGKGSGFFVFVPMG